MVLVYSVYNYNTFPEISIIFQLIQMRSVLWRSAVSQNQEISTNESILIWKAYNVTTLICRGGGGKLATCI